MKHIKVLGPGCPKCAALAENVITAAEQLGIDYEVQKVTDLQAIMAHGVMITPGLVIDDEVKSVGKLLSPDDLKTLLEGE